MTAAIEASQEQTPATQAELCRFLAGNSSGERLPVYPVGGRTALSCGGAVTTPGIALSVTGLNRTIEYPARDMTVTVEAGVRAGELSKLLAGEQQRLPIDIPQSRRATIGGAVATGVSGPRRFGSGTLRDCVIGISAADAEGRLYSAGGRVVKNVAGYDLCRLLTGSLGTLGIITQITFRLRPLPEFSAFVWSTWPNAAALDIAIGELMCSAVRPMAIEVLCPKAARQIVTESRLDAGRDDLVLAVGFEGTENEVRWQTDQLRELLHRAGAGSCEQIDQPEQVSRLWDALTDFQVQSEEPLTFRASLPPSQTIAFIELCRQQEVTVQSHAGNGIVTGHLPDSASTVEAAGRITETLRKEAVRHRGSLVLLNCDENWKQQLSVFGERGGGWQWDNRLRQSLDPQGLLNPGRMPAS
ncbi:MAG: FAD-binding oxidoreductase [Planctomycetaceae bacterium]|nr:FAD-binding oxidoreductase [Planctomycetaceae bacterium]